MSLDLKHLARSSRLLPSSALTKATKILAVYAPGHTVAYITKERGPAPAWYHQGTGEIVLSLDFLDGVSDTKLFESFRAEGGAWAVHFGRRIEDDRTETWGTVAGIFQHEVAHSRWSRWMYESFDKVKALTDRPRAVADVLRLWEEVRIEKRAYDRSTLARVGFRYSFDYLVRKLTEDEPTNILEVAHLWTLTVGRAFAGIVEPDEVLAINDLACTIIGDAEVADLREILDEAVVWNQENWVYDLSTIVRLAEEWLDVLGITEDAVLGLPLLVLGEDGDPIDLDLDTDEEGDPGHGKGHAADDGKGWSKISPEESKRLLEAVHAAGEVVADDAHREVISLSNPREWAAQVFGKKRTRGSQWDVRQPTHEERMAVIKLAAELSRISYQAPAVRKVPTAVPPGRMRSRDAVRRSAERAGGRMVTAQPWERKKRRHAQNPPMTLGLMTDTSGSMSWAQEVVASAAYIFANAINRIGGRSAAVTFGDWVESVVHPGEIPTKVASRRANGSTERFDRAAAALDGVLHLTDGARGAKILVVICDGGLVEDFEPEKATAWLEKMRRSGTAVVWIDSDTHRNKEWIPKWVEKVAINIHSGDDFDQVVGVIADAMERAFRLARGVVL